MFWEVKDFSFHNDSLLVYFLLYFSLACIAYMVSFVLVFMIGFMIARENYLHGEFI